VAAAAAAIAIAEAACWCEPEAFGGGTGIGGRPRLGMDGSYRAPGLENPGKPGSIPAIGGGTGKPGIPFATGGVSFFTVLSFSIVTRAPECSS